MKQRAIVTLVHGTWGHGFFPRWRQFWTGNAPIWSELESSFVKDLKCSLEKAGYDPEFVPFDWSGANSIIERDCTARALAERLDERAGSEPKAIQIVIGHSHGGNIILSAARYYRRTSAPIFLITMATPFLDVMRVAKKGTGKWRRYSESSHYFKKNKQSFFSLTIFFIASLIIKRVSPHWLFTSPNIPSVIIIILLFSCVYYTLYHLCYPYVKKRACHYEDALERVVMFDSTPGVGASSIRLLVLRGTDDEASLALAAGSLNALIARPTLRLLIMGHTLLMITTVLLLLILPVYWAFFGETHGIVRFLQIPVVVIVIIFALVSVFESVSASAFGKEFLLGGAMFRIYSNSAPDSVCDMRVLTLPIQKGRRHRLYAHRDCIPSIVAWLTSQ